MELRSRADEGVGQSTTEYWESSNCSANAYQAADLVGFSDAVADIAGAGLDSYSARSTHSHSPTLARKSAAGIAYHPKPVVVVVVVGIVPVAVRRTAVISYQLSVISYQLSVISYQLSVISYRCEMFLQ